MRINQFIARSTALSRRKADEAVTQGRVEINGQPATAGSQVEASDIVTLDGRAITPAVKTVTVLLNKPVGYVCSHEGQGSKTIYDLMPPEYQSLNIAGRLDKDSSGLVILTNDGTLLNQLTHPSFNKEKIYDVTLDKPLTEEDRHKITEQGVDIGDKRPSRFQIIQNSKLEIQVSLSEGRNRQIRRTFAAAGYKVIKLHRRSMGSYRLQGLEAGQILVVC
ncbi:MAG: rRNA pseudouridine synthase [Candidatus Saccharibacteria bacterium]|nr:rRNA pseudouridine synthase [Candidatus Saccharibacteria bacterium]